MALQYLTEDLFVVRSAIERSEVFSVNHESKIKENLKLIDYGILFKNLDDCDLFYEFSHNSRMTIIEVLIKNLTYILSNETISSSPIM